MVRVVEFTGDSEARLREREPVAPGPGEVAVSTRVSGVSPGSELLVYRGEAPDELSVDESIDALDGSFSYPLAYGYAAVGDVVAVGDGVAEERLGDTVFAFNPHESRFVVDADATVPVPEGLPPAVAAMLPTAETATNFVLDGEPTVGERAVVFGCGIVGLATTALLSSFPLERLVAVDPVERRRERARSLGADRAVEPDAVAETLPPVEGDDPGGADLVYELSGRPETLNDAVAVAGFDARVVVGSWYGTKRAPLDLGSRFHRERIDLRPSQVSTLAPARRGRWTADRRLDAAVDHLRRMDAASLVTDRLPLSKAPTAYERLDAEPESTLQVILEHDESDHE